jgi:hypothetical protein
MYGNNPRGSVMRMIQKEFQDLRSSYSIPNFIEWLDEMKQLLLKAQLNHPERVYKFISVEVSPARYSDDSDEVKFNVTYERPFTPNEVLANALKTDISRRKKIEEVMEGLTKLGINYPPELLEMRRNPIAPENTPQEDLIAYNKARIAEMDAIIKAETRVEQEEEESE